MPNTTAQTHTSEEVAQRVGDNINTLLDSRGLSLEWLAGEIGISVDRVLEAFSERMPLWLVLDASDYLGVAPHALIGAQDA